MIVIRPIATGDFQSYIDLAFQAHINFYTLPKSEQLLEHQFQKSLTSFIQNVEGPGRQYYLFVAEDTAAKRVVGVAALAATSGGNEPLFFFRREHLLQNSPLKAVVKQLEVLNPISYLHGPSEVCSLFVEPAARGTGVGKLLSLARFLFAARYPERFTGSFISELRGMIENGTSPFWEGVGRHFFDVTFDEVQEMMNYGRSFINHFLPTYPIYVSLLPEGVQRVIGKVDSETQAAFSMLSRLGFEVSSEVDVIDAGPKLVAKKEFVRPIASSTTLIVHKIREIAKDSHQLLISNEKLDFRALMAPVDLKESTIAPEVAAHLKVGIGDTIRIFDPRSLA